MMNWTEHADPGGSLSRAAACDRQNFPCSYAHITSALVQPEVHQPIFILRASNTNVLSCPSAFHPHTEGTLEISVTRLKQVHKCKVFDKLAKSQLGWRLRWRVDHR